MLFQCVFKFFSLLPFLLPSPSSPSCSPPYVSLIFSLTNFTHPSFFALPPFYPSPSSSASSSSSSSPLFLPPLPCPSLLSPPPSPLSLNPLGPMQWVRWTESITLGPMACAQWIESNGSSPMEWARWIQSNVVGPVD